MTDKADFVEVKTQGLSGAALDWAVAYATKAWEWAHEWFPTMTLDPTFRGVSDNAPGGYVNLVPSNPMRQGSQAFKPSTDWAQGGPLIEKYRVSIIYSDEVCDPQAWTDETAAWHGPTPLVAACRAIVASVLGDTLNVPKELLA